MALPTKLSPATSARARKAHPDFPTGLIVQALDDALTARIVHLFEVLALGDNLDDGLVIFERNLHKAIEAYDLVRSHLLNIA